jgi:hypothetical protein
VREGVRLAMVEGGLGGDEEVRKHVLERERVWGVCLVCLFVCLFDCLVCLFVCLFYLEGRLQKVVEFPVLRVLQLVVPVRCRIVFFGGGVGMFYRFFRSNKPHMYTQTQTHT